MTDHFGCRVAGFHSGQAGGKLDSALSPRGWALRWSTEVPSLLQLPLNSLSHDFGKKLEANSLTACQAPSPRPGMVTNRDSLVTSQLLTSTLHSQVLDFLSFLLSFRCDSPSVPALASVPSVKLPSTSAFLSKDGLCFSSPLWCVLCCLNHWVNGVLGWKRGDHVA